MLTGFMLFLHLSGLAIWVGSMVMVAFMLTAIRRQPAMAGASVMVPRMLRTFNVLTHPSAFIVLISGVVMIIDMGFLGQQKPFWLSFMEQGGGMVILLSIILLSIMGKRVVKRYAGEAAAADPGKVKGEKGYLNAMIAMIVLVLAVVLVVALKL